MEETILFDLGLKIGEVLKNSDIVKKYKCGNMGVCGDQNHEHLSNCIRLDLSR